MTQDTWFYTMHGKRVGPVRLQEITDLLVAGRLPTSTMVWTAGLSGWVPASKVPEITSSLPPPIPPPDRYNRPRGYLTSCTNCRRRLVAFSYRDQAGRVFCSEQCVEWFNGPRRFCAKCVAETTKGSVSGLVRINGCGNTFLGYSSKCATCNSVVRREVITILFVPVFPRKRYRVLYAAPKNFYSRQMKTT
jgi:hypothetical protein